VSPADRILGSRDETDRLLVTMLRDDRKLAESLDNAGITREVLTGIVQENRAQISQSVTPESDAVASAQLVADSAAQLAITPRQIRVLPLMPSLAALLAGLAVVVGAIVSSEVVRVTRQQLFWLAAASVLGGLLALLGLFRWFAKRWNEDSAERARRQNERLDVSGASQRLDAARAALDTALIGRGIRPLALARLEQVVTPEYDTVLSYVSAKGLSEIYNAERFEVSTRGLAQVKRILDYTPGGSVGLAGPRGTGKSTVIASFVAGRTRIGGSTRGLAVEVSAPVDYDRREFLLHLFAEVCRDVFVIEPTPGLYEAELASRVQRSASRNRTLLTALLAAALVTAGVLTLLIAWHRLKFHPQFWIGFALIAASGVAGLWSIVSPNRARSGERGELRRREAGIPKRPYESDLVDMARQDLAMIRYQQTYTSSWTGSLTATVGPLAAQAGITGETSYQQNVLSLPDIVAEFQRFIARAAQYGPVVIGIDELDKIQNPDRAQAFLNDIKSVFGLVNCYYLVSISEEALASFERRGLPIRDAFDSALDDVVRIAPLDYKTGRKLIRSRVIGLPEPYVALAYCLSGGLPRDMIRWTRSIVMAGKQENGESEPGAADAGVAEPGAADAGVADAGVADAGVAEVGVADPSVPGDGEGVADPADGSAGEAEEDKRPRLTEVTAALVGEDVQRKVQASLIALSELSDPDAADSMNYLGGLRVSAISSWLFTRSEDCLRPRPSPSPELPGWLAAFVPGLRADHAGRGLADSPPRRLMFELAGYFYFCATVLEIFTDELSAEAFTELAREDGAATFGQLAHARQLFGTDARLAVSRIDAFRAACDLPRARLGGPMPKSQPDMSAQFTGPRPTSTIQT
jgi:hypothetical protein